MSKCNCDLALGEDRIVVQTGIGMASCRLNLKTHVRSDVS